MQVDDTLRECSFVQCNHCFEAVGDLRTSKDFRGYLYELWGAERLVHDVQVSASEIRGARAVKNILDFYELLHDRERLQLMFECPQLFTLKVDRGNGLVVEDPFTCCRYCGNNLSQDPAMRQRTSLREKARHGSQRKLICATPGVQACTS